MRLLLRVDGQHFLKMTRGKVGPTVAPAVSLAQGINSHRTAESRWTEYEVVPFDKSSVRRRPRSLPPPSGQVAPVKSLDHDFANGVGKVEGSLPRRLVDSSCDLVEFCSLNVRRMVARYMYFGHRIALCLGEHCCPGILQQCTSSRSDTRRPMYFVSHRQAGARGAEAHAVSTGRDRPHSSRPSVGPIRQGLPQAMPAPCEVAAGSRRFVPRYADVERRA
jgi:hypothetical protein